MDLGISGNSAVVTGSSRGLGKASAAALAREGAHVVVNGRHAEDVDATVEELGELGDGDVLGYVGDITRDQDVTELIETAVSAFGGLDHLVTSAGGPPEGLLGEIPDEEWEAGFELLVMSYLRVLREAAEYLRADGGGTIVDIESISVKETFGSLGLGSTVRMPTIGIGKIMARDLGPEVRVNTVLPGLYETGRFEEHVRHGVEEGQFESYEDGIESYGEGTPLDRIGEPSELGSVVAFLSSEQSSYLTGAAIPVDGGMTNSNL